MYGGLICYATKCSEGTIEDFWLALLIAVVFAIITVIAGYFITKGK